MPAIKQKRLHNASGTRRYLNRLDALKTGKRSEAELGKTLQGRKKSSRAWAEARNELVQRNLKFAAKVAKRRWECFGSGKFVDAIDIDDVIQASATGMIKAAERFNPDKKARFITYAEKWCREEADKEIMKHMSQADIKKSMMGNALRTIRVHEKAEAGIISMKDAEKQARMKIEKARKIFPKTIRLDQEAGEGKKTADFMAKLFPNHFTTDPREAIHRRELVKRFRKILENAPVGRTSKAVIKERYLKEGKQPSKVEVANILARKGIVSQETGKKYTPQNIGYLEKQFFKNPRVREELERLL